MTDDFMEEWIDPFDLLQEHQQIINKLMVAFSHQERLMGDLVMHNRELTNTVVSMSHRISVLENK